MIEDSGGVGDDSAASSSRLKSSFEKNGERMRFTVELRPGETTIVSWKKLMKDAHRVDVPPPPTAELPVNVHPNLEARLAPGLSGPSELKDGPTTNRMNAVIEKIERLYTGKDSSDEEDLNDIPDDDQYDTEDSFIDDAELDEYFEVDKSKTKHDGFFVNRGKLESIEISQSPIQKTRKRRRKDVTRAPGESNHAHGPNKQMKVGRKVAEKSALSVEKNSLPTLHSLSARSEHSNEFKSQNQYNASGTSTQNIVVNEEKYVGRQQTGLYLANGSGNKLIDGSELPDLVHAKHHDRSTNEQYKSQPVKLNNVGRSEVSPLQKAKNGAQGRIDLNLPSGKHSLHSADSGFYDETSNVQRNPVPQKRDGSSVRPKGNMLEKAIRELEKMVAESWPRTNDRQDADASFQSGKRRLPPEIKQKLAKVARFTQGSHDKVSKELLNRLMSIVGHLVQLRTLKRNLKIMINTSLTAKQETDDKFQRIKKEVVEMIKMCPPSSISKASETYLGGSDDFQELRREDKEPLRAQYCMDASVEDKLCDLYDIFVDGLDGDATPHVRKLYAELAELWPKGVVDHHGIKRAICRAKERRRTLHDKNKDHEKLKRKKLDAPRLEGQGTVQAEASSAAQPLYVQERIVTDSGNHVTNSQAHLISNPSATALGTTTTSATTALHVTNPSPNGLVVNRPKKSKVKVSSYNNSKTGADPLVKKKVKRKPKTYLSKTHLPPEKYGMRVDDGQKSFKQAAVSVASDPQRSSFQLAGHPSFEQLT